MFFKKFNWISQIFFYFMLKCFEFDNFEVEQALNILFILFLNFFSFFVDNLDDDGITYKKAPMDIGKSIVFF